MPDLATYARASNMLDHLTNIAGGIDEDLALQQAAIIRTTLKDLHIQATDAKAERNQLREQLVKAERERDSLARRCSVRYEETQQLREQLARAEEAKHDLLPLPALEISAQEIRARALQLAAEHFGGDVYECADELAAYITTGQHPGKDHTDE